MRVTVCLLALSFVTTAGAQGLPGPVGESFTNQFAPGLSSEHGVHSSPDVGNRGNVASSSSVGRSSLSSDLVTETARFPDTIADRPPGRLIVTKGTDSDDCISQLSAGHGWCEIPVDAMSVMRTVAETGQPMYGVQGPRASWGKYVSMAYNWPKIWIHGGGHNSTGIPDVYEFDFSTADLERIYTAPPYNVTYLRSDGKYAPKHDVSIPDSTHTYDGFEYDAENDLILLLTGVDYRWGFTDENPGIGPVVKEYGQGLYAFNPSPTETIKGISPRTWKRLSDHWFGGYTFLEPLGDGRWVMGSWQGNANSVTGQWVGDDFIINFTPFGKTWPSMPPNIEVIDGEIITKGQNTIGARNVDGTNGRALPNGGAFLEHGYTLTTYGDDLLFWNGHRKISTYNKTTGEWLIFDYSNGTDPHRTEDLFDRFFKLPGYDDYFVGWYQWNENPVIYRHPATGGVPPTPFAEPSLKDMLAASDEVIAQPNALYKDSVGLFGSKTLDMQGSEIYQHNHPHQGFIELSGGPHVIKNLKSTKQGRSAIWAKRTPVFTLDGFVIERQNFGVLTSNDGGTATIRNGVIRGGPSSRPGYEHNIYIGRIDAATVDNVRSLGHPNLGHLFKSRARVNAILNSVFDGLNSNHSRVMDFPCGGTITLKNVTLRQSPNSDNRDIIGVSREGCAEQDSVVTIEGITVEAGRPDAFFISKGPGVRLVCLGTNKFIGLNDPC